MLSTNLSTDHLQTAEILETIFAHLTLEEVKTAQAVCKKWNIIAKSPIVWAPYLNRLKALDPKICVLPPENYSQSWYYERFVENFKRIAQAQQAEIKRFLDDDWRTRECCNTKTLELIANNEKAPTTLQELEDRHQNLQNLLAAKSAELQARKRARNESPPETLYQIWFPSQDNAPAVCVTANQFPLLFTVHLLPPGNNQNINFSNADGFNEDNSLDSDDTDNDNSGSGPNKKPRKQ